MKVISLNAWGCRIPELFDYLKEKADSTDIFCFQEILKSGVGKTHREEIKNGFEEIQKTLPNHIGYFSEYGEGGYYSENSKNLDFKYGIACFALSSLKQKFVKGITLYDLATKWNDYEGRFAAGAALAIKIEHYTIVNVHGLWQGGIKKDTEAKIQQSKKILTLAGKDTDKKVICGDFNLLPNTTSIQLFADQYQNLIQKYQITSTRSSLYTKELRYSDYAFVDKKTNVINFTLPNLTISDHLPLEIEFE